MEILQCWDSQVNPPDPQYLQELNVLRNRVAELSCPPTEMTKWLSLPEIPTCSVKKYLEPFPFLYLKTLPKIFLHRKYCPVIKIP